MQITRIKIFVPCLKIYSVVFHKVKQGSHSNNKILLLHFSSKNAKILPFGSNHGADSGSTFILPLSYQSIELRDVKDFQSKYEETETKIKVDFK